MVRRTLAISYEGRTTLPRFTMTGLPDGQVGRAYFFQLRATYQGDCGVGSSGHIEFGLVDGALPPMMKLSKDGALDGSPSRSGAYRFTVVATMSVNLDYPPVESQSINYSLTILP